MLKKDIIELCLLKLLSTEDMYGYEILRRLHTAFPDTQESAIYAQLRSLCKQSYTESCTGQTSEGPARKYYRLTPQGQLQLGKQLAEWRRLRQTLTEMGIE